MFCRLLLLLCAVAIVAAAPLQPTFSSCENYYNAAPGVNRLNVSNIYAEIVPGPRAVQLGLTGEGADVLRVDLIGSVGAPVLGYDNGTNKLATLFTDTTIGGISVYSSTSWVCNSLFPATLPTPYYPFNTTYCPLPAGPFGLNISIPLFRNYALTTLSTQIRIVDTSFAANTLSCVNVSFTPYHQDGWYYDLFLWLPVALVVGFWVTSWGARFAAGWVVGSGVAEYGAKDQHGEMRRKELDKAGKRDARIRKWGTMIVSSLSGERLSVSSGLLRFVTPGLRDIMHHIQFCTILVMVAVSWPHFAYPIVARLAWADLVWNSTLITGSPNTHPTSYPTNTSLPTDFMDQMFQSQYPLYLDTDSFNPLFDLGSSASGLESFAHAVGLRPQDLFGTCLSIFLIIAAAVIFVSLLIWVTHALTEVFATERPRVTTTANKRTSYASSAGNSLAAEKMYDPKSPPLTPGWERSQDQLPMTTSQSQLNLSRVRGPTPMRRAWYRFRPRGEAGAFHAAALYGNLLRLILIFHLPITVFSTYQLVLASRASIVSRVFAAISLVLVSILIPAGVMWKVYKTPGGKLYDATRTLLAMGTMYNHYVMDKQMFRIVPLTASLVTGIVIGAGQKSGIAQGAVLVIVELALLVVPAVWYPWGEGGSMGAPSVFLGVIRVASALLVMLLSPVFAMTESTRIWLAYAVLLLNALAFIFFLFMLLTKLLEGLIRLSGGVHFDESTHPLDGGIFAAIADLDCLNGVTGGKAAARKRRKKGARQLQRNVSAAGSLTTQRMLDKHSQGFARQPPGSPEYPSPYPRLSDGYFPAYQPPLGPPPLDRHSSDSRNEESGGGGNIMDAWRTRSNEGYKPPGTYAPTATSPTRQYPPGSPIDDTTPSAAGPSRSFSVVRGGRADVYNPYDVQGDSKVSEFGRSRSPPVIRVGHATMPTRPLHQREYSSPVVIESYDATTPGAGPSTSTSGIYSTFPISGNGSSAKTKRLSANMEPVEHVPLRPPQITIPKRRSLNDLKNEAESTSSEYSDSPHKKGKRGPRTWFSRTADRGGEDETEEESDDEPGPSRQRGTQTRPTRTVGPVEDATPVGEARKGWKSKLRIGGRRSLDDEGERMRDENRARHDALANESGALFVGVDSPIKKRPTTNNSGTGGQGSTGFKVHRKNQSTSHSIASGSGKSKAIGHAIPLNTLSYAGPSRPTSTSSGTPQLSPIEGERSFTVKRLGQPPLRATPEVTPPTSALPESSSASPYAMSVEGMSKTVYPPNLSVRQSGDSQERSFKVLRPDHTPRSSIDRSAPVTIDLTAKHIPSSSSSSSRSFVVKRAKANTDVSGFGQRAGPPILDVPINDTEQNQQGYSFDAFVPYDAKANYGDQLR